MWDDDPKYINELLKELDIQDVDDEPDSLISYKTDFYSVIDKEDGEMNLE